MPDVVASRAVAPWTTVPQPSSGDVADVVRGWLCAPSFDGVRLDDGRESSPAVEVETAEVAEVFGAGDRVAFAASWTGTYRGGLADVPDRIPDVSLGAAGVVRVTGGRVADGWVVTDRLGLRRSLPRNL